MLLQTAVGTILVLELNCLIRCILYEIADLFLFFNSIPVMF